MTKRWAWNPFFPQYTGKFKGSVEIRPIRPGRLGVHVFYRPRTVSFPDLEWHAYPYVVGYREPRCDYMTGFWTIRPPKAYDYEEAGEAGPEDFEAFCRAFGIEDPANE